MTTANHLINALAAQNQDEANLSFEAMIQDKIGDYLEVRKVELASTIMDDLQEGSGVARQYTRQVGAMMAASPAKEGGPGRSIHRGELKAHAAKLVRKLGPDMVKHHADTIKNVRAGVKIRAKVDAMKEEALDEVLSGGAKQVPVQPSNAALNRNVMANIRRAVQTLGVKGVNPAMAAAGHRDFGKLVARNPKAPGYALLRKLAPGKAAAVQSLTQAGVPLGQSLEASPQEFNQVVQRIKRFK
jgi:hypothetical protein